MGNFSQFSVARELLQRGELEQALVEVDRLVALGQSVILGAIGIGLS
jgi:hypothetical protein